jgi:CRISPR-associated protein Csd1
MIKELAEFGNRKRIETNNCEDSLDYEMIDIIIEISKEGDFKNIYSTEKESIVEDVIRTEDKGRTSGIVPRLLVDNAQYVLGFPNDKKRAIECLQKFRDKIEKYKSIDELLPIIRFYDKKELGLNKAYEAFKLKIEKKELDERGTIAFFLDGSENFLHESQTVFNAIIEKYTKDENEKKGNDNKPCAICGSIEYRTKNIAVHGVIKKVPDGQTAGCSLVSYNADAFESYELSGNDNSTICTHCIKNYIIGMKWLMVNGKMVSLEKEKAKNKEVFIPTNRRNFGKDTAMIYWTREEETIEDINLLDSPDVSEVTKLISSVMEGNQKPVKWVKPNQFYSCTLSGAAARIAIRDWVEISLGDYKQNLVRWFQQIAIRAYGETRYIPLYALAKAGHNTKSDRDPTNARVATQLWNAAIKNSTPPLWILTAVLKRIRFVESSEDGQIKETITPERAALIRFILNRNTKNGGYMIKEQNDTNDKSPAIVCGKIFAVMESIQRVAQGNDLNAGIRERFFSFASTSPAHAFGRLMKLSQNHISKLKHEKPGLAVLLDRQLQELCSFLNGFPAIFSLEEQGQFALGYYHQKQQDYDNAKKNKELQPIIENKED